MAAGKRTGAEPPIGAPRKLHDIQIDLRMTRSYYAVLNDDRRFRRELGLLFEGFHRIGFHHTLAELFARHWALPPRHSANDLWWSYRWWRPGRPARLQVGSRFFPPSPTKRMPPQLVDPKRRMVRAHRLYRYVVLGHSHSRIAADDDVDVRAAFDSIQYWSTRTGIPLPHRPPALSHPSKHDSAKPQ